MENYTPTHPSPRFTGIPKRGYAESEINNALMQLEIKGKIIVSNIKKTQRKIELIREGQDYLPVGED